MRACDDGGEAKWFRPGKGGLMIVHLLGKEETHYYVRPATTLCQHGRPPPPKKKPRARLPSACKLTAPIIIRGRGRGRWKAAPPPSRPARTQGRRTPRTTGVETNEQGRHAGRQLSRSFPWRLPFQPASAATLRASA
ncbi:hypothetical protein BDA96_06G263400 [Sorghum bicolor]|uniref:Uncharacterized protein n=2 Tax=Sorghum bicolor TaxID=4558 RepID=A0A921UDL9_SORBI|nr:hypothetical protein BDA96_06G263400 [Sorghum bicolor]KXG27255.1 hypothetical protein SORBI_3006G240600 [Sorghum bicolor]